MWGNQSSDMVLQEASQCLQSGLIVPVGDEIGEKQGTRTGTTGSRAAGGEGRLNGRAAGRARECAPGGSRGTGPVREGRDEACRRSPFTALWLVTP